MMWNILMYTATVLVMLYILLDITWRLWKLKYSFLPNAPNVPWLGSAPYLGTSSRDFYKAVTAFAPRYDRLYILWIGPIPVVRAGCVEYIEAVLRGQETLTKSSLYEIIHDWLGFGLLTSTGKKWKERRTALTGAFHFTILNEFTDTLVSHAQHLVEKLQTFANNGKAIDIQSLISLSTLDVICDTSMGVKINALDSSDSEYVKAVHDVKILMLLRLINPFLKTKFVYQMTSSGKTFYKNLNILHNFTIGIINKNIAERKSIPVADAMDKNAMDKNTSDQTDEDTVDQKKKSVKTSYGKKRVFLDLLIDLYEKGEIDIEGIREEVDTFMFEGHDTTSSGMSWTLYEIGRRPEIQQKLHDEIVSVSLSESPILEKIRNLKYLEHVIKECARFHPPVPMYGRIVEKDLKVGEDTIPAGTEVIVEAFSVHMNNKYWDEPTVFKPERFESEAFLKRNPYCYVPFSAGPRNCIGQKFAMLELKFFIYYILSAFKIKSVQSPDELETCYDIITYSANGINIELYSR